MLRKLAVLSFVVAACGDDDPVRHLDGGIDSPMQMVDAPTMTDPVTLTITVDGQPQMGIKVYFLNPDSSVVSNTTTDATGVASAVMMLGGSVTAIDPYPSPSGVVEHGVYTFQGVKPGDHLKLADDRGGTGMSVTINGPEDTDPSTASYLFSTPCDSASVQSPGSGSSPVASLYLDSDCGTATDFLVTSLDGSNNVLHYFYVSNETVAATIDFTAKTWTAPTTKTYEIDNTAYFNNEISVTQYLSSTKGRLAQLTPINTSQGLPYTYSLATPAFTNALSVIETDGAAGGLAQHQIIEWGPFVSTQYTLDAGAKALVDIATDPLIDTATHAVTWTEGSTGQSPDMALGVAYAYREAAALAWSWQIIGPHTDTALHFPTLPTDVADFNIAEGDTTGLEGVAILKVPGGYDAVRADFFSTNGPEDIITSATGTMALALYQSSGPARPAHSRQWLAGGHVKIQGELTKAASSVRLPKKALSGRRK